MSDSALVDICTFITKWKYPPPFVILMRPPFRSTRLGLFWHNRDIICFTIAESALTRVVRNLGNWMERRREQRPQKVGEWMKWLNAGDVKEKTNGSDETPDLERSRSLTCWWLCSKTLWPCGGCSDVRVRPPRVEERKWWRDEAQRGPNTTKPLQVWWI